MNRCVYIHELIEIIGHGRNRYMQHMTANWVPVALEERNQRCFGVWATVGSTGRWPEVVNLWELDDWDGLTANFEVEFAGGRTQDPSLAEWWATAAALRRGGRDRIVVPTAWSPPVAAHQATGGTGAGVYVHELLTIPGGGAERLLADLGEWGRSGFERAGAVLVGAFRSAMRLDDEAIVIWGFADWRAWADFEQAWLGGASEFARWQSSLAALGASMERIALVDAPLSPLRTGRQPRTEDRIPLDQIR